MFLCAEFESSSQLARPTERCEKKKRPVQILRSGGSVPIWNIDIDGYQDALLPKLQVDQLRSRSRVGSEVPVSILDR